MGRSPLLRGQVSSLSVCAHGPPITNSNSVNCLTVRVMHDFTSLPLVLGFKDERLEENRGQQSRDNDEDRAVRERCRRTDTSHSPKAVPKLLLLQIFVSYQFSVISSLVSSHI